MENINLVVAQNLVKFRTLAGLTQMELAKKIKYSDKSISKWERGESLPDVAVLVQLAEIYGVTLNDFVDKDTQIKSVPKKVEKLSHNLITFLSGGVVWLVASVIFVVLTLIPSTKPIAWLTYIYAIPVFGIVLTVFACKWAPHYIRAICISVILWGAILSICLSTHISNIWLVCIIGGVLEILIILWTILQKITFEKTKLKEKLLKIFKFKSSAKSNKIESNSN